MSDVPIDVSRLELSPETVAAIPPRWRTLTSALTQVRFAIRYLNNREITLGECWALGLSLFVDEDGAIVREITVTHRFEAVQHMLEAFAAGVASKLRASERVWTNVEQLVPHAVEVPDRFVAMLGRACTHQHSLLPAVRIASRIGDRAREAIEHARDSARGKNRARLAEALELLARPRLRPMLDELLERALRVWRDTGDPDLVPAIAAYGRETAYRRGPCRSGDEQGWAALARALDPADLDRLLDCPWPTDSYSPDEAVLDRLMILGARDADPRLARLRELAQAYAWAPPILAKVEALAARAEPPQRGRADALLLDELRAAMLPLLRRDELFAQCAAHRDDLPSLAVLGDHLLELGDPRGELIALELAGKPTDAVVAEHAARWTPPIDGVENPVFARGVLVELHIRPSAGQLRSALDHPAWRWVERLRVHAHQPRYSYLLQEPPVELGPLLHRMPALRDLVVDNAASLRSLEGSHPLRRLEWRAGDNRFPDRATFPELEILALPSYGMQEWLFAAANELGVRVLTLIGSTGVPEAAQRAAGPSLVRITPSHTWWVELPRSGDRAYLFGWVAMKWRDSQLANLMPALANAGFRRLSLHASTRISELPVERDGLTCDAFDGPIDPLGP